MIPIQFYPDFVRGVIPRHIWLVISDLMASRPYNSHSVGEVRDAQHEIFLNNKWYVSHSIKYTLISIRAVVNEDSRWSLTKKGVTLCVTTIRSSMTRNCYILLPMAIGGGWNLIGFSLNHYNRKGENPLSLWMLIWRNCPQPRRTVCGNTKSHEEHRVLNTSIRSLKKTSFVMA